MGNAEYTEDEIRPLIEEYIQHRAQGYQKESFPPCDYRTIESHLEKNPNLKPEKKRLAEAERQGYQEWERIGKGIATGKVMGNPTAWIFTMKNKFGWADKQVIESSNTQRIIMTDADGNKIDPKDTDL